MEELEYLAECSLDNYLETDRHTRIFAGELVTKQVYFNQNIKY
jgi:1-deoxy-D-xylulose-5-phosphate reductoisomerase